jgi:DNA gyrase subunit A
MVALTTPLFIMNVYDRVVPNGAIASLIALAIGMAIAIVFDFILRTVRSRIIDMTGKKIDVVLAANIFEHVLAVKMAQRPQSVGILANQLRDFDSVRQIVMATRKGTVKKTALAEYSRPKSGGIIAIKLDEGDELIDVVLVSPSEDLLIATANGMAIRFSQEDARSMGRATFGVKGINLVAGDYVVGMVVANPEMDLLTVCEHGFGKRTPFGPGVADEGVSDEDDGADDSVDAAAAETPAEPLEGEETTDETGESGEAVKSGMSFRRQRRGGKGLRNIRTTDRNGKVVDVTAVNDQDEVLMVTAAGKIQRIRAGDINEIGRNTQGVRVIRLEENDKLVSMARIPADLEAEAALLTPDVTPPTIPPIVPPTPPETPTEE